MKLTTLILGINTIPRQSTMASNFLISLSLNGQQYECRLTAERIKRAQFNTIIKHNRNNLPETIRLLHRFDRQMCVDWVNDEYSEKEAENTTDFWKYCVRQYLYNPAYLSNEQPDVFQNTEGWLEYEMVDHIRNIFGYYDVSENFPEQCISNFDWLSPEEVDLAKMKIDNWE